MNAVYGFQLEFRRKVKMLKRKNKLKSLKKQKLYFISDIVCIQRCTEFYTEKRH
jgi:hypothetical protein